MIRTTDRIDQQGSMDMSTTTQSSTARTVAKGVGLAVVFAVAGMIAMLAAGLLALQDLDVTKGLIARSVLVTIVLVAVTLFSDRGRPLVGLVLIAFAGYALNPATWEGRAFVGQLWFDPGLATVVVDAVAWIALVAAIGALVRGAASGPGR